MELRRTGGEEFDGTSETELAEPTRAKPPKIRCPKCRFQPRKTDRWGCLCGCWWNTFDTRGRCPDCQKQWLDTQCLRCHAWSPHDDWYEPDDARR